MFCRKIKILMYLIGLLCAVCFSLEATDPKKIGLFTYKVYGMDPWDPDSIKKGITGSEEAVIYMSEQLARLGYQVIVYGDPPEGSRHSLETANPRYVPCNTINSEMFDVAISWRMVAAAEKLRQISKKVYLWPHDTCHCIFNEEQVQQFDDVLWLSEWQRKQWISLNPAFSKFTHIFGNGIIVENFAEVKPKENPYSCIYASNYSRGLETLLQIWPKVKFLYPKATLDIYYGWQHWGLLTPDKESEMKVLIEHLSSKDVREHGLVSHEELTKAFEKASIWTYPCTGLETFCITALKAQLAGALPVIIEGSALLETVPHGLRSLDVQHYSDVLLRALKMVEGVSLEERKKMGDFIKERYTWEKIALKWKELFEKDGSEK